MPVIQAIQAVVGRTAGGGGPPPPPPPVQGDFFWAADQDTWQAFGGIYTSGTFSSSQPANPSFTYLDGSYTGKTRDFTGSEWTISPNLAIGGAWQSNTITIDYWFYPTENDVQLLSEHGLNDVDSGYRYTVLEITSTGYVKARYYNGTALISVNTVTLNQWNHIWFTEDSQGGHSFELNGVPTTGNPVYTRSGPLQNSATGEYFSIGDADVTNMGSTRGFRGKVGWLNIHDYVVSSTYPDTISKFKANSTVHNGVTYTLTPKVNGDANDSSANPGDVISWTIDSASSEAGKTIIWWIDGFAVPANDFVENPSYSGNSGAGSVTLDSNGSATWSLTVVAVPPTHASFRLYISETLYQGWLTHTYVSV